MTTTGGPEEDVPVPRSDRDRRLLPAAGALIIAGALAVTLGAVSPRLGLTRDPLVLAVAGYLVFWIPLAAVAVWAVPRRHVSFRPLDLLWGLGAGLLARSVASLIELAVYGRVLVPGAQPTIEGIGPNPVLLAITMIVAPLFIAPIVEEAFFRGTLLPAIRGQNAGVFSAAVSVVASALIFALMHLLGVTSVSAGIVTGLSALALGLAAGILMVGTGRLAAPITAHVVFNAMVVVPALL